ncbi:hypothetical protein Bequi_03445 [Brachybacterium sp. JHP9]|uniref:Uncharacterized protein n=1 Tax=Brachybacterium equifaecis TaxID=2910770 RepID=A0ABT0QXR1_9MICO|nr:hypothetical protein [Brachybacterium equifaecis]MCL6422446.1 hypothetical protein [Brachybacterium equifaecis]
MHLSSSGTPSPKRTPASRRALLRGTAWAVPTAAVMVAAPALAISRTDFTLVRTSNLGDTNKAAHTDTLALRNLSADRPTREGTVTISVTQTSGSTTKRATPSLGTSNAATKWFSLSNPTVTTGTDGYRTWTWTITIKTGFRPNDGVTFNMNWPDRISQPANYTFSGQILEDANPANNTLTYTKS